MLTARLYTSILPSCGMEKNCDFALIDQNTDLKQWYVNVAFYFQYYISDGMS